MDANGTRFHLLLGENDWLPPASPAGEGRWDGVEWDSRAQALSLLSEVFEFPFPAGDRPPSLADRRGAAADQFGNWYWITPGAAEIRVLSAGDGLPGHFWSADDGEPRPPRSRPTFGPLDPPAPPTPVSLAGLAVTDDHYLVAGTTAPAGLLVFDLRAGGGPVRAPWPADPQFVPFDLAPRKGGGVWILDRVNARLWALDRSFAVVPLGSGAAPAAAPDFAPLDPGAASGNPVRPRAGVEDAASLTPLGGDPIAIDTDDDGLVFLLLRDDGKPSRIQLLRDGIAAGPAWTLEDDAVHFRAARNQPPEAAEKIAVTVVGHDLAVAGTRVYVVDAGGNQAYAFDRDGANLSVYHAYFPMRLFGGNALATGPDGPYYDSGESFVPLIEQHRPRFLDLGTVETRVFEATAPGAVWHRLVLDAWMPAAGSVRVESRAADDRDALASAAWIQEPEPILRPSGPELPFIRLRDAGALQSYELLFQRARGRFLQVRLQLAGDGRVSPRLRALRIWYERFSYLQRYLPKVYREDAESASFLDRFLANPEGIFTGIEDAVAAAQVLLDPRTAPSDALDWLAGFFDVALDPVWDEARRRLFLQHAIDFFACRGTIPGLQLALALAFDDCADASLFSDTANVRTQAARIIERFRLRSMPALVLGDPTEEDGPRLAPGANRWTPDQGGDELHRRYADYVDTPGARFPLDPSAAPSRATWARFADDVLGFEPAAQPTDTDAWQLFLRRRYRTIDALNSDYATFGASRHASFDDVALPTSLPPDGAPVADWYLLETIVLPTRQLAHRFTVLLPVSPGSTNQDHAARKALAERIVALQKPAHTSFTVRFYWAAFRVGEVRLDDAAIVDLGSRAPALLAAAVVGQSSLGESTLAGDPPVPLAPIRQETP